MPVPDPPRPPRPSRVSPKGQVTIPKPVRDALDIGPGSAVEFEVTPSGDVLLKKRPESGRPLRGFLSAYALGDPVSAEDLDAGIGREVASLDARSRGAAEDG